MKMKVRFLFLSLALMLATQGFAQNTPVFGKYGTYYDQRELLFERLSTSPGDIVFLGNSITDGAEWSEIFENPRCKNRGISGDVIPGVLNRLETITKGRPAMVFLMIGTNDMARGVSNDSIVQGVRTVVQRIKAESPETHIIVQSILPTNDCYGLFTGHTKRWQDVPVINEMIRTMAIDEGVDYLDLYHPFATEEGKLNPHYSNDGLHLSGYGYKKWKDVIENNYGSFPKPIYKPGKNQVWLHSGTGLNIVDCYDEGASPLPYFGVGLNVHPGISLLINNVSYSWIKFKGLGNITVSNVQTQAFDFGIELDMGSLYRFYDAGDLHLWAGGGLINYIDINYSSQLMNAALGYSYLNHLNAECLVQYDFAKYGGSHNFLTTYGKLSLPLFGLASRPGFAYIDNATGHLMGNEQAESNREAFVIGFPGVSTDIGLFVNLLNNNKIGVSYCWDYLTTRHKGIYRFDHANHSFNLTFMFNLN